MLILPLNITQVVIFSRISIKFQHCCNIERLGLITKFISNNFINFVSTLLYFCVNTLYMHHNIDNILCFSPLGAMVD